MADMDAARAIVEANRFMTLATADADGVPWASPVWFAPDGERELPVGLVARSAALAEPRRAPRGWRS